MDPSLAAPMGPSPVAPIEGLRRSAAQEAALHAARVRLADWPARLRGWVCPFCVRWFWRKPVKWNRAFLVFRFHGWPCHPGCLTGQVPDPAECGVQPEGRLPGRWWAWRRRRA